MKRPKLQGEAGGWILVVLGIALIALAAIFADKEAVAPVFAFGGIAAVVIGVVLGRIEGEFELGVTKLRTQLTALAGVAEREDLTLDQKGNELVEIVEEIRGTPAVAKGNAQTLAAIDKARGGKLTVRLGHSAAERGYLAEQTVADYFRRDGWIVDESPPGMPFDFIAEKEGEERRLIEVKAARRLSMADVGNFLGMISVDQMPEGRPVLAVVGGTLSAQAAEFLKQAGVPVDVLVLDLALESEARGQE